MFTHAKKRLSEVCLVGLLKPLGKKRGTFNNNHKAHISSLGSTNKTGLGSTTNYLSVDSSTLSSSSSQQATNINQYKKQQELREQQRKKQQKRKEKLKQLEEEREKDKMKWQSFAHKVGLLGF